MNLKPSDFRPLIAGPEFLPMNVWLVTVGEPLPLPGETARLWRTGLLAKVLVARGHRVTWWTSTVNHFKKEYFALSDEKKRIEDRLELQFLHGQLYRKNISMGRWRNHIQIARAFRRLAGLHPVPDIILCSYPTVELSAELVSYGHRTGVPVLLDIRDLWPDEIASRVPKLLRPLLPVLLRPMYRQAEFALRNATGVVAISERYLEWGLKHARRGRKREDRVFTHGYPIPAMPELGTGVRDALRTPGVDPCKRIACFMGTFVGSIDLPTVITAARLLSDEKELQFVLAGSGERESEWRSLAVGLQNVVFTGWLSQQQLSALASVSWVGLGAYKKGALMSLTNKIFEYMAFGLPILLSLPGEAQELVEECGCGVYYEPGSAESLAGAIRCLLNDPNRRDDMAEQARRIFKTRYSSEAIYTSLAIHLEATGRSSEKSRP